MKITIVAGCLFFTVLTTAAQNVGIGTNAPHPSAKLHVESTNQGLLVPRISIPNRAASAPVTTPATGLLVWNTNAAMINGSGTGFYYWDGGQWATLGGGANTLDEAYDEGGPGAGRIITADAGRVEVNGTGGLLVNTTTNTLSTSIQSTQTSSVSSSDVRIGYMGVSGTNTVAQGVRSTVSFTAANNGYDGGWGFLGTVKHPTDGTINLNTIVGSVNKAVGVGGIISGLSSFTGGPQDVIAAVYGVTGLHNSRRGSVTGSKLYAGLFVGNGRTAGLWDENSTYMELLPRWQLRDYDAAVVGFYNSAANGGNNGSNIGRGDAYFSIETNVTDATAKDLVLQNRSTGDVGIKTNNPTANLSVNGTANKTGGGAWAVFSDARLKEDVTQYTEGLDLITQINPVNFKYNATMDRIWGSSASTSGQVFQGVIAQELQEVAPDMVREVGIDRLLDNGLKEEQVETYLEVDPNKFTYALINAVKELKAELDAVKAELKALKQVE